MNEVDEQALEYAINNAVEFMRELGTTDLASMQADEVHELMRVIICRYQERASR